MARNKARRAAGTKPKAKAESDLSALALLVLDVDGVLTDGGIILDSDGRDIKQFNSIDGAGIKYWQRAGGHVAIISGRSSPAVLHRATELGVTLVRQNAKDKLPAYQAILAELGLKERQAAVMGDDLPDLPLFWRCGFAVAPANAVPEVRAAANLVTETGTSIGTGTGRQVYLRDTCFGVSASCNPTTQLISTDPNGTLLGTEGILPSISASGRYVAFLAVTKSQATQASAAASKSAASATDSGYRQVFVRDTCLGAANCTPKTTRISLQPGDGSGTGTATAKPAGPAISGSADHVALAGGTTATLFMHSVAIDDGVFLALTKNQ
jgi:3-deoxy-D-manno-octulosonate 8-phosphate phosphatase (KDO 8-P phosphatase)